MKKQSARIILFIIFTLLISLFKEPAISANTGIKKISIPKPKSYPLLKEYFTPDKDKYVKTDNGVQVHFYLKGTNGGMQHELDAKKSGRTLWNKEYHAGVSLLAVEGNHIFLNEQNQNTAINGPSTLVVLNTLGKIVYRKPLNGAIAYNGYESVRFGDVLYYVTDRFYDRINEGGTTPGKQYSQVIGVSITSGKILWVKKLGVVNHPPILYKGKVYVTDQFSNGLISFDSTGKETELIKDSTFINAPQFSPKGQLYMTSFSKNKESIKVYDQNFRLSWTKSYDGNLFNITFDQDLVFLSTYDFDGDIGRTYAYTNEGKLLWSIKYPGYIAQGAIVSGNIRLIHSTDIFS